MSYLNNNPFNRPSPNFTSNLNTYSSYDYSAGGNKSPTYYGTEANYNTGGKYDSYGGGYMGNSSRGGE